MRLVLALALLAPFCLGQDAIPPAEIPKEATAAAKKLAGFTQLIVADVAPDLETVARALTARAVDPFLALGRRRTIAKLDELEAEWRREEARFARWDKEFSDQGQALRAALGELEKLQALWRTSRSPELPTDVVARVDETLAAIAALRPRLKEAETRLVARRDRLERGETAVQGALAMIVEERDDLRARLFTLDSPPLWKIESDGPLSQQFRGTTPSEQAEFAEWAKASETHALVHAGVAILAFFLVLRLRSLVRAWAVEDASLQATARVFSRPLAATLLVALLIVRWLYPEAPPIVYHLADLALLAPILWLLFGLISARAVLYLLALLFVVDRLREFSVDGTYLHRMLLVAECAVGIIGVRLFRPLVRDVAGRRGRWLSRGNKFALFLFLGSIVANVVGAGHLAALLASATAMSISVAVIFYAGGLVLYGIVAVGLRTELAGHLRMVKRHRDLVSRRLLLALQLVLIGTWLWLTTGPFAVRDLLVRWIRACLEAELTLGNLAVSLGDVLGLFLVIYATVLISRLIRFVLSEDVLPRLPLPRGVPAAISTVGHYVILLVGFFFAIAAAGLDLSKIAFLIGAFGVGIGFGLQTVVNNFVSGLILLFERPIQVGDWLETSGLHGEVTRIGIRSSTLRTLDAAEVIIPNGQLLEGNLINWTLSDPNRRVHLPIGVAYGSDVAKVMEVLLKAALEHPIALDHPKPEVLFVGFGNSSLDFNVRFWIPTFRDMHPALSALHVAVHEALREAGITIPFPQRDLHLRSVDPGAVWPAAPAPAPDPEPKTDR